MKAYLMIAFAVYIVGVQLTLVGTYALQSWRDIREYPRYHSWSDVFDAVHRDAVFMFSRALGWPYFAYRALVGPSTYEGGGE